MNTSLGDINIVGVDCATVDAKVGLAQGCLNNGSLEIRQANLCGREQQAASLVARWISERPGPTLLAIDAPLGWPVPLAEALIQHRAGEPLHTPANAMFRRAADVFIHDELGKTPLDVGADRIARTAYAALRLLDDLRARLTLPIPLAWGPEDVTQVAAIEVYPAASLLAHGLRSGGYKKREQIQQRREIVDALRQRLTIAEGVPDLATSADLVDAGVCLLAGMDFLQGETHGPRDPELAQREGWIWVSKRRAPVQRIEYQPVEP